MYCMNCGKEMGGNIPVCGECLQGVLDKCKAEQDILTRVNLEAQSFVVAKAEEKTIDKTSLVTPLGENSDIALDETKKKSEDTDLFVMVVIIVTILICVVLIVEATA